MLITGQTSHTVLLGNRIIYWYVRSRGQDIWKRLKRSYQTCRFLRPTPFNIPDRVRVYYYIPEFTQSNPASNYKGVYYLRMAGACKLDRHVDGGWSIFSLRKSPPKTSLARYGRIIQYRTQQESLQHYLPPNFRRP